eukprot:TRINITY_DN6127_c0_g1_i2.p1 TRINITY_DN6127_c0_g1~~TRINITY_DN6127_c0_g1_i2.p1  ORF type:complete len:892 (-),score=220.77 TRINITY_DN6127_c0_g1_i2:758-3433(-)
MTGTLQTKNVVKLEQHMAERDERQAVKEGWKLLSLVSARKNANLKRMGGGDSKTGKLAELVSQTWSISHDLHDNEDSVEALANEYAARAREIKTQGSNKPQQTQVSSIYEQPVVPSRSPASSPLPAVGRIITEPPKQGSGPATPVTNRGLADESTIHQVRGGGLPASNVDRESTDSSGAVTARGKLESNPDDSNDGALDTVGARPASAGRGGNAVHLLARMEETKAHAAAQGKGKNTGGILDAYGDKALLPSKIKKTPQRSRAAHELQKSALNSPWNRFFSPQPSNGESGEHDQKPKFYHQLVRFLEEEIELRGCPHEGPHEGTLQVYRECFRMFIEELRTYRPFLARVLKEYDTVLENLSEQVSYLQPLHTRLATLQQETEVRLAEAKARHRETLDEVRRVFESNKSEVRKKQREEANLLDEYDRLQAKLLKAQELLDDRLKSNALLLEGLKNAEEEEGGRQAKERENRQQSDRARDRFEQLEADCFAALQEYRQYQEEIGSMVKKSELDKLEKQGQKMQKKLFWYKNLLQTMQSEVVELAEEHEKQTTEYENLVLEVERCKMRTPRPNWASASDYLPREDVAYLNAPEKPSSVSMVEKLYAEMDRINVDITNVKKLLPKEFTEPETYGRHGQFFRGLGTGSHIPAYLRVTGKVRNRKISKRDCENMIKDVWVQKAVWDRKHGRSNLGDFLFQYLQKRFGIQSMIAEWGYNLTDALDLYQWDGDCKLFLDILTGELDEDVYTDQMEMLEKLEQAFAHADIRSKRGKKGVATGTIKRAQVMQIVRKFFPAKSEKNLYAIRGGLEEDVGDVKYVDYVKLMAEDRDGNQGDFVETIREQHLEEREQYCEEIAVCLAPASLSLSLSLSLSVSLPRGSHVPSLFLFFPPECHQVD